MKKSVSYVISTICLLLTATAFAEDKVDSNKEVAAPTAETAPSQLLGKMPVLESTVGQYVSAWQKDDFKTMLRYENWEGGSELNEIAYIQSFDGGFHISEWKITKVEDLGNDQYKVLVLITHTPPSQVASLIPEGRMVRSTLVQFWKKQGEQFVHQYNVEKQELWGQYQDQMPAPKQ
jgi:hypothetical protein